MGKIVITIILVNIEYTIIQTIIFVFENMCLFSMSLTKKTFGTVNFEFSPYKIHKMVKNKMFQFKII